MFRLFFSIYLVHEIVFLSFLDFDAISIRIRWCYSFEIIDGEP